MNYKTLFFVSVLLVGISSCKPKVEGCTDSTATNYDTNAEKDDGSCTYAQNGAQLVFKFQFNESQPRLNGFGQPATIPSGNAAQSPTYNSISRPLH